MVRFWATFLKFLFSLSLDPTKKVEIHQDPAIAYVGEEVRYTCTADGYPDAEIK